MNPDTQNAKSLNQNWTDCFHLLFTDVLLSMQHYFLDTQIWEKKHVYNVCIHSVLPFRPEHFDNITHDVLPFKAHREKPSGISQPTSAVLKCDVLTTSKAGCWPWRDGEHATFWSGVRRATDCATRSLFYGRIHPPVTRHHSHTGALVTYCGCVCMCTPKKPYSESTMFRLYSLWIYNSSIKLSVHVLVSCHVWNAHAHLCACVEISSKCAQPVSAWYSYSSSQAEQCHIYLMDELMRNLILVWIFRKADDPDVIWTRNLLIWSQTRYRCATRSLDVTAEFTHENTTSFTYWSIGDLLWV